jgi:hypothetical protein
LGSIISLDMDVEKLTPPKTKAKTSIDVKKEIQNTEE